jgi:hypothetical protein
VQVVVLVGGRVHVAVAVRVDEDADVPGHVSQRPEAALVGVVAVHGVAHGDRRPGLRVVGAVLLVHPHHELASGLVVHHLGPLDVCRAELRVARLGEHVVAELPVDEVRRPVGRDVPERVVRVPVLAEPVVVLTHLDHPAAVGVQRVARRVGELGRVDDGLGLGLGGDRAYSGRQYAGQGSEGSMKTPHRYHTPSSQCRGSGVVQGGAVVRSRRAGTPFPGSPLAQNFGVRRRRRQPFTVNPWSVP